MTWSDPPPPPPGPGWGPPPGPGWGPPPGPASGPPPGPGWGPPGATKPAASVLPIVLVTVPLSLFGLIPTVMASNRASDRHESSGRYWVAFLVSLLGSIVLYAVVFVLLAFVILRSAFGIVDDAIDSLPSVTAPAFPSAPVTGTPTAPTTAGSVPAAGPCVYTPDGSGSAVTLPDATPVAATTWTLVTTAGTIVVALDATAAPCTVNSIVHLTQLGFYDNSPCPRSVDVGLSILQCGDPTGTGAGGPGYTFDDENLSAADYGAGSVAMANSGPGTNGSQFFLTDRDQNGVLQPDYTVFGTITSGLDVLTAIIAAGNDGPGGDGRPTPPVSIVSATVA